jgi:uncharacterized protein with GYD domain
LETYVLLIRAPGPVSLQLFYGSGDETNEHLGVKGSIEEVGGVFVDKYAVTGRYDAVVIAKFPDNESCLAWQYVSNREGFYTEPMHAFDVEGVERARQKADLILFGSSQQEETSG